MSLTLANNVGALSAQHNLNRSSNALNRSLERLSSGLKVNRGADGPASLVISEQQRAQISGLRQAIENAEKATSMVQTAEGALTEINSLLVKIRGLALDSANAGVNDDDALAALALPVLVTIGSSDVMVSPRMGEHIAAVTPGARLSRYPAVGHAPFLEVRERFDRELAAFADEAWSARGLAADGA